MQITDIQTSRRRNPAAITAIILAILAVLVFHAPILAVPLAIGAIIGGGIGEHLSRKQGSGYGMQKTSLLSLLVGILVVVGVFL